jgi:hypothetical protein
MKVYRRRRRTAPPILHLGSRWHLSILPTGHFIRWKIAGALCLGCWLGHRDGRGVLEQRRSLPRSRVPDRPACTCSLSRLRYPGYQISRSCVVGTAHSSTVTSLSTRLHGITFHRTVILAACVSSGYIHVSLLSGHKHPHSQLARYIIRVMHR